MLTAEKLTIYYLKDWFKVIAMYSGRLKILIICTVYSEEASYVVHTTINLVDTSLGKG